MQKMMRRAKPVFFWSIVAILGAIAVSRYASASTTTGTTYYISSSIGSDSNNGTSKTTPWAHMPGMAGCSGNCASYTPVAGDQFVLYGGDIWTISTTGTFSWSGTPTNHIKIGGLDTTWFNASSCSAIGTVNTKTASSLYSDQMNVRLGSSTAWGVTPQMIGTSGWTINGTGNYTITARAFGANFASFSVTPDPGTQSNVTMANSTGYYCQPRFDGANTLVSGCASSGGPSCDILNVSGSYVDVNNIDFARWDSPNSNAISNASAANQLKTTGSGINNTATGNYFHDWTNSSGSPTTFGQWASGTLAMQTMIGNMCTQLNSSTVGGGCIWLGSNTSPATATGNVCMWVNDCLDGHAHGMVANGNVGYDWYTSQDSNDHGNFLHNMCSGYFYDNLSFAYDPNGPGVSGIMTEDDMSDCVFSSLTTYTWNNVIFRTGNQQCFTDRRNQNGTGTIYHINDTCVPNSFTQKAVRVTTDGSLCPTTVYIVNMHVIEPSYSGSNSPVTSSGTSASDPFTYVDGGCATPTGINITTSVAMSTSTATSQGYTAANFYQPKSGSNSTVAKGTNMASNCTGALQNLCTALNILTPIQLGPKRPLAGTGNWDAGAYQFASNTGSLPAAPTNLTTTVTTQ